MNTKHTPGPWIIGTPPPSGEQTIGSGSAGGVIVAVATTGVDMEAITLANAHLIAAAPDMLEALKAALSLIEIIIPFDGEVNRMVRNAIAKAEGGAA